MKKHVLVLLILLSPVLAPIDNRVSDLMVSETSAPHQELIGSGQSMAEELELLEELAKAEESERIDSSQRDATSSIVPTTDSEFAEDYFGAARGIERIQPEVLEVTDYQSPKKSLIHPHRYLDSSGRYRTPGNQRESKAEYKYSADEDNIPSDWYGEISTRSTKLREDNQARVDHKHKTISSQHRTLQNRYHVSTERYTVLKNADELYGEYREEPVGGQRVWTEDPQTLLDMARFDRIVNQIRLNSVERDHLQHERGTDVQDKDNGINTMSRQLAGAYVENVAKQFPADSPEIGLNENPFQIDQGNTENKRSPIDQSSFGNGRISDNAPESDSPVYRSYSENGRIPVNLPDSDNPGDKSYSGNNRFIANLPASDVQSSSVDNIINLPIKSDNSNLRVDDFDRKIEQPPYGVTDNVNTGGDYRSDRDSIVTATGSDSRGFDHNAVHDEFREHVPDIPPAIAPVGAYGDRRGNKAGTILLPDPCKNLQCGNFGRCVVQLVGVAKTAACECSAVWSGPSCTIPRDPCRTVGPQCAPFPCTRDATHVTTGFTCNCDRRPGWRARDSERNPSCVPISCDSRPCLNGGICRESAGKTQVTCQCVESTSGQWCDVLTADSQSAGGMNTNQFPLSAFKSTGDFTNRQYSPDFSPKIQLQHGTDKMRPNDEQQTNMYPSAAQLYPRLGDQKQHQSGGTIQQSYSNTQRESDGFRPDEKPRQYKTDIPNDNNRPERGFDERHPFPGQGGYYDRSGSGDQKDISAQSGVHQNILNPNTNEESDMLPEQIQDLNTGNRLQHNNDERSILPEQIRDANTGIRLQHNDEERSILPEQIQDANTGIWLKHNNDERSILPEQIQDPNTEIRLQHNDEERSISPEQFQNPNTGFLFQHSELNSGKESEISRIKQMLESKVRSAPDSRVPSELPKHFPDQTLLTGEIQQPVGYTGDQRGDPNWAVQTRIPAMREEWPTTQPSTRHYRQLALPHTQKRHKKKKSSSVTHSSRIHRQRAPPVLQLLLQNSEAMLSRAALSVRHESST